MKYTTRSSVLLFALLASCSSASESPHDPPASDNATTNPTVSPLGKFRADWNHVTSTFTITNLSDNESELTAKSADTLTAVPASSTGVPPGGGVVAFSPVPGTSCGSTCVSGPINFVNRTSGNILLRNVYGVMTSITGAALANSDSQRSFSGIPSNVGVIYYEHLMPNGYASEGGVGVLDAAQDPTTTIGFRGQRTWQFTTDTPGGDFHFNFDVYAAEVSCTPTGVAEDATVSPDTDADCDGVPGASRALSLLVDPTYGSDSFGQGTVRLPYATATKAVTMVSGSRGVVAIAARSLSDTGKYIDASSSNLTQILGGFDGDNGFGGARASTATSTVVSLAGDSTSQDQFGLKRVGVSSALFVQRLTIASPAGHAGTSTAAAGSTYAMFLSGSGTGTVTLDNVALDATSGGGLGFAGTAGVAGANPTSAMNGASGSGMLAGTGGSSPSTCGNGTTVPGVGGAGGAGALVGGTNGNNGTNGFGSDGGLGGNGGKGGFVCDKNAATGKAGKVGISNKDGTAGSGGSASGVFTDTGWAASSAGSGTSGGVGSAGSSGGGGGGGGSCFVLFGGGGGGGATGGCAGTAGTGGGMGGASVALFSANVPVSFGTVTFAAKAGNGGAGGAGGSGAAGGTGGLGQAGSSVNGNGGAGASGQTGGSGGGGGGGAGGPGYCAVSKGAALILPGGACTTPIAASGGSGGASAHPGTSGASGSVGVSLAY